MKKILFAAIGLCAMTSVASADPMRLDSSQMDGVTAGLFDTQLNLAVVIPVNTIVNTQTATAVGVLNGNRSDVVARNRANNSIRNPINIRQRNRD